MPDDDPTRETTEAGPGEGVVLTVPAEIPSAAEVDPGDSPAWAASGADALQATAPDAVDSAGVEPILAAVQALQDDMSRRLDAVQTSLDREIRSEAVRERVVDRLHAELQEYKQDLLLRVQRPIFVDLIQLHDDVGKMIEAACAGDSGAAASERARLESIQTALEDVLYRQGVEPFTVETEVFDARRQRAIATVAVSEPALNKTVRARVRKGFQAGDKVIRPELVTVCTYRPE